MPEKECLQRGRREQEQRDEMPKIRMRKKKLTSEHVLEKDKKKEGVFLNIGGKRKGRVKF